MAQEKNLPENPASDPVESETDVYGTQEWPNSLFRSDRVCPLPHDPKRSRRIFNDWAAI